MQQLASLRDQTPTREGRKLIDLLTSTGRTSFGLLLDGIPVFFRTRVLYCQPESAPLTLASTDV